MNVIDLSHPLYTGMPVYKGDPEVKIDVIHTHAQQTWELRYLQLGSHTGTHVDACSHMHKGMPTLDELPIERFFGPAYVVDHEADWPKEKGLFFTEEIGDKYVEKLLQSRPLFVGGKITESLQRALLGAGIITYTDLLHLELIPKGDEFMFYGFPLNIQAGDGSPVRAVAMLNV